MGGMDRMDRMGMGGMGRDYRQMLAGMNLKGMREDMGKYFQK